MPREESLPIKRKGPLSNQKHFSKLDLYKADTYWQTVAHRAAASEHQRAAAGLIRVKTAQVFSSRLQNYITPFFSDRPIDEICYEDFAKLATHLLDQGLSTPTVRQVLQVARKVLVWALERGLVGRVPLLPVIRTRSEPRGGFSPPELLVLWRTARRLSAQPSGGIDPANGSTNSSAALPALPQQDHRCRRAGVYTRPTAETPLPAYFPWLIMFMLNTFIRPTDLKNIRHRHVTVVRNGHTYLRLDLPESKRHSEVMVSLRPAVRIYERILKTAAVTGHDRPNDYLFYPECEDREAAMMVMTVQFRRLLDQAGLRIGKRGQSRSLYSLRHTAITYRLRYGQGIDLLTLAKNARTSVAMIEKFYASELGPEMNVGMLQSRRRNNWQMEQTGQTGTMARG